MIIILLIITGLLMISMFKPSNFKIKTVKEIAISAFEACQKDKTVFNITMAIVYLFTYVYSIITALVIKDLFFIAVTILYMAWSAMDYGIVTNYILKDKDHVLLNNRLYRFGSKILDFAYFGYIIYALIQKM